MPRGIVHNLKGKTFGMLTVLSQARAGVWLCECACGETIERSTSHLRDKRRTAFVQSCGCHGGRAPIKWATLYRGELRGLSEIAKMTGIHYRELLRIASAGSLNEAYLDAWVARRERYAKARASGLPAYVVLQRIRKLGWDEERAYTQPLRACKRATTIEMALDRIGGV